MRSIKLYHRTFIVIGFLILFFPVGIFLVWKTPLWQLRTKAIVSVLLVAFLSAGIVGIINSPPLIDVTSSLASTAHETYSLKGTVNPGVLLYVNGKITNARDGKFTAELKLTPGDNKIYIFAQDGNKKSSKQVIVHRFADGELAAQKRHATELLAQKQAQDAEKAANALAKQQQNKPVIKPPATPIPTPAPKATAPATKPLLRPDLAFHGDATYCDGYYVDNGNGTTSWRLTIKQSGELITHLSDNSGHIYRHDEHVGPYAYSYTAPVAISNVSEITGLLYVGNDSHPCNINPQS